MLLNNQIIVPKYISGLDKFQETILTPQEIGAYSGNNPSGFITGVDLSNYVTKTNGEFINRPTVNGTGVLLSGEAAQVDLSSTVRTSGNQTISGEKIFKDRIGIGESLYDFGFSDFESPATLQLADYGNSELRLGGRATDQKKTISFYDDSVIDFQIVNDVANDFENLHISGKGDRKVNFNNRPTVNGTGVLLNGEAYSASNPSGFITGIDLSSYATNANLNLTGSTLNTKINSLSGAAVLLYSDQIINGTKYFNNDVYIHDLYVTGTEFIANVENNFIESPYILLNLTGGAIDGGMFFVTGAGLTGVNDYGPIIGFDHSNKFKFGFARRSDDLSVLNDIAAVQDITNYSGFANNNFYLKSNPSGFITGVDLSSYATVNNLSLTGSNLQTQINNINSSGFITGVDLSNYATNLNLQNTGQNLNQKIDNLSGYSTGTFATINNLNITGSGLQQSINIVSSSLAITGQNLQSQIDDLSVKSIAYAIALG